MEGKLDLQKVGPSELELNRERLASLREEHRHLCYEMKKRESVHGSNGTKAQQQMKQQWTKIVELKKQKADLTLQLRLQDSESFSNKGNKNMEKFLKLLDDMVRLEEQVKKQTMEIDKYNVEIAEADKKIRQKQKECIKSNRNKDKIMKLHKDVSLLESRLNASFTKYNQLLVANNSLREDIGSLLQTQATFRKQHSNMKHRIAAGRKAMSEIVHSAMTSYQTGESVKLKLNLLNERTQVDQKKLEERIKELQLLIEQDKHLKEFIHFKGKDRSTIDVLEETEANKELLLEQKLQEYQTLMGRIQQASGCKDVNRICKMFTQLEGTNVDLFARVNTLNVEMERLNEEVRGERGELDVLSRRYREQKQRDMAEKDEINAITEKLRQEAVETEDATDMKAEELQCVKGILRRMYHYLDDVSCHKVSFTVDEAVTDDNVLLYLEALEKRVLELIEYRKFLDRKEIYYYCEE